MRRFGLFHCGDVAYAVPLSRLVKVLHHQPCFRLPLLPAGVAGVLVENDALVPLLSLDRLFSAAKTKDHSAYQVLVESEGGCLALPAEQTHGIVPEQKGSLDCTAEMSSGGVRGELHYQQKKFHVLDIDFLAIGLTQGSW